MPQRKDHPEWKNIIQLKSKSGCSPEFTLCGALKNILFFYTSSSSSNRPRPPLKRPPFPPNGEKSSSSIFGGLNMSSLSSSAAVTMYINGIEHHTGNNQPAVKITDANLKKNVCITLMMNESPTLWLCRLWFFPAFTFLLRCQCFQDMTW